MIGMINFSKLSLLPFSPKATIFGKNSMASYIPFQLVFNQFAGPVLVMQQNKTSDMPEVAELVKLQEI